MATAMDEKIDQLAGKLGSPYERMIRELMKKKGISRDEAAAALELPTPVMAGGTGINPNIKTSKPVTRTMNLAPTKRDATFERMEGILKNKKEPYKFGSETLELKEVPKEADPRLPAFRKQTQIRKEELHKVPENAPDKDYLYSEDERMKQLRKRLQREPEPLPEDTAGLPFFNMPKRLQMKAFDRTTKPAVISEEKPVKVDKKYLKRKE